jgi:exosortase/archaeosortase family protein
VGIGAFFGVHSGNTRHAACLVVLSLPVSVVANTLRITLTGFIHLYPGHEWAEGTLHEAEGLVTALIGVAMLFGAARLLNRWMRGGKAQPAAVSRTETRLSSPANEHDGLGIVTRLVLVSTLLLPAIALDHSFQRAAASYRRPPVALRAPLSEFPNQLGSWTGQDTPVAREYFLYGDDHLNRVYINRQTGQTLTLWMVYTQDGRDRIHHPRICMKAIGCREVTNRTQQIPLPGKRQSAWKYYFEQPSNGSGQWVVYWNHVFDSGDPVEHSPVLKLLAAPPSRRSGLTAEIFAPELTPADSDGADEFATLVEQLLQETLLPATM